MIGGVRQSEYETYYVDNGTILFIGIFLGALFLMGTAMIIYYKQISEGYIIRFVLTLADTTDHDGIL